MRAGSCEGFVTAQGRALNPVLELQSSALRLVQGTSWMEALGEELARGWRRRLAGQLGAFPDPGLACRHMQALGRVDRGVPWSYDVCSEPGLDDCRVLQCPPQPKCYLPMCECPAANTKPCALPQVPRECFLGWAGSVLSHARPAMYKRNCVPGIPFFCAHERACSVRVCCVSSK